MKATLEITDGPAAGRRIDVPQGTAVKIGRSDRADVSVPGDPEMSGVHFAVECNGKTCLVRDLDSTNGTFLNGEAVSEAAISPGDRLRAGGSLFSLSTEDETGTEPTSTAVNSGTASTAAAASAASGLEEERDPDGFTARSAEELSQECDLEDEARELLQPSQSPRDFLQTLIDQEILLDAVRFMGCALPKRHAVWWACRCVRQGLGEDLSEPDAAALEAAETWALDPNEENRRAAMAAAEASEFETAASWPAVGAFWSGGSMAPPDAPAVPPGEELTGKAVAGAVQLAAVAVEPEKAPEKHRTFIEEGFAVARGDVPWEQQETA